MRYKLKAREWNKKQIIGCLLAMVFLTAFAWLQWPQKYSQAAPRAVSFEEWAAGEDAQSVHAPRPITPEGYSDMLTALGEAPPVPSSPEECEALLEEQALEANYLALDAGKIDSTTP